MGTPRGSGGESRGVTGEGRESRAGQEEGRLPAEGRAPAGRAGSPPVFKVCPGAAGRCAEPLPEQRARPGSRGGRGRRSGGRRDPGKFTLVPSGWRAAGLGRAMEKDEIHLRRLPAAAPWGPRKCGQRRAGERAGWGRFAARPGTGSAPRCPDKGFIISVSSTIFKNPEIIAAEYR